MNARPFLASAGVAGLFLVAAVAFAAPAHAAASDCGSNRACAWIDSNYSGAIGRWTASASTLPGFNNAISSTLNNRATTNGWFTDPGYAGSPFYVPPGGGGYFNWPDWRNDSFSSLYIY